MKELLSLEEIRVIQNGMLKKFDEYCAEKGYSYCLWAGTLLGAIRHKGHIPWDDDVDVVMPRADYERMLLDYEQSPIEGVRLVSYQQTENYYYPFAKITDESTEMQEGNLDRQDYGVYVDIVPLDTLPSNEKKARRLIKKCRMAFYLLYLNLQKKKEWTGFRAIANACLLPIAKLTPRKQFSVYMEKQIKKYAEESSDTVTVLTHSSLARQSVKLADVFPTQKTEFETLELSVPKEYDAILTRLYGDYMQPPPVEKQVAKHSVNVWRKECK